MINTAQMLIDVIEGEEDLFDNLSCTCGCSQFYDKEVVVLGESMYTALFCEDCGAQQTGDTWESDL